MGRIQESGKYFIRILKIKMKKIVVSDKKSLISNPVFLNGISRAGKFFLGKIMAGFNDVEYFQYISVLEHTPFLERLGCINESAAISLLRVNLDEHAYNMFIGRNLNFRFDDASSINNSLDADRYSKRSLIAIDSEKVVKGIKNKERMPLFILHECLPNIRIFFKAFPNLMWINLMRHPIDLIHSWYVRGWGHRFSDDPLSFVPVFKGKCGGYVPWFAYEWSKEFRKMPEIDRVINSILVLNKMDMGVIKSLSFRQKKQVLMITFEDLVERTDKTLEQIGSFLNIIISPRMPKILKNENCPKEISLKQRQVKAMNIKKIASRKMFNNMMRLAEHYEKHFLGK